MYRKMFFIIAVPFVMAACGKSSSSTTTTCTNIPITTSAPASERTTLEEYLTNNSIPFEKDTLSGLCYHIIDSGTGTVTPQYCSKILVTYAGTILGGSSTPFDHNYDGATFNVYGVITGWQRGVQLIKKGGTITLYIPPSLAYGSTGSGTTIPANANLRFDISLLDITN